MAHQVFYGNNSQAHQLPAVRTGAPGSSYSRCDIDKVAGFCVIVYQQGQHRQAHHFMSCKTLEALWLLDSSSGRYLEWMCLCVSDYIYIQPSSVTPRLAPEECYL